MHPYRAYQQPAMVGMTRIDLILALYEGTLKRLEQGLDALKRNDRPAAQARLARAQVLIAGLAAGVDPEQGELPRNFLRLYDFALTSVRQETVAGVEAALRILRTLEEGLVGIRPAAQQQELSGQIPSVDLVLGTSATA